MKTLFDTLSVDRILSFVKEVDFFLLKKSKVAFDVTVSQVPYMYMTTVSSASEIYT